MGSRRRLWEVAVGAAAALLVFGAVPGVLAGFVGAPFPARWTRAQVLGWHGLFDLLSLAAWCAWAACAWPLLRSVVARVRARDPSGGAPPGGLPFGDRLALRISVAVLAVVPGALAGTVAAGAATAPITAVATSGPGHPGRDDRAAAAGTEHDRGADALGRSPRPHQPHDDEGGRRSSAPPPRHSIPPMLPEAGVLGAGALVAALLARRARQARRLQSFLRAEGAPSLAPSEAAADLAGAVDGFEDLPQLEWVELAMRQFDASIAAAGHGQRIPTPALVRAGPDGVELRFGTAAPAAPAPWISIPGGSWMLESSLDREVLRRDVAGHRPWTPILLPVGEDENGSWLVALTAGACLSVLGPSARAMVHAMVATVTNWAWHEQLVVTGDAAMTIQSVRAGLDERNDGSPWPGVLSVGDPRSLPPAVRSRCAVVTTSIVENADVAVFVDDRAATLHPFGLAVRPHLLDSAWAQAVSEVGSIDTAPFRRDPPSDGLTGGEPPVKPGGLVPPLRRLGGKDATVRVSAAPFTSPDAATPSVPATAPGPADVRLLVAVPAIAGLRTPLPTKRSRRAIEVVSYIAMHAPDPVTGDRLRTRVLGTADADAASKTLFNIVGAARRSLGLGPHGEALFPPATRSGHYRLSPLVTVDALRMIGLVTAGLAAATAGERLVLLEEGLAQVRGEPLSGVLSGYAWWRAEGHERRVSDAVVDGACALVRLAIRAGHLDLARWAVERARRVEVYSEALTRASMEVAASTGDARRLHREWQECLRQVDELDPGGTPSDATERLYSRLRAQLAGSTRPAGSAAALGV